VLANKESLVMAGEIMMATCRKNKAQIIPVDSEHNAIYQCMPEGYTPGTRAETVNRITLTASGGPFRGWSYKAMAEATPEQAIAHPNWSMGNKISVDSATMMNKGLEIIEASWLFNMPLAQINALVHPQSLVHALVEYIDSTVLAQLAVPDMRVAISYALSCPDRLLARADFLQLAQEQQLTFEPVDYQRFPCLQLAYEALKIGGSAPAILNAVNEVAVETFLQRSIGFTDIAKIAHKTLETVNIEKINDIDDVMLADSQARCYARKIIEQIAS
jgi:1-deoxy-D-xylulose-5-phosphate reductoisomerase